MERGRGRRTGADRLVNLLELVAGSVVVALGSDALEVIAVVLPAVQEERRKSANALGQPGMKGKAPVTGLVGVGETCYVEVSRGDDEGTADRAYRRNQRSVKRIS